MKRNTKRQVKAQRPKNKRGLKTGESKAAVNTFKGKLRGKGQKDRFKMIAGEKYIYLAMAYQLAKNNGGQIVIGNDNGYVGGQKYYRRFNIQKYEGKIILTETRYSKAFADFSRSFEVIEGKHRPSILEYFNESGENCSKIWIH